MQGKGHKCSVVRDIPALLPQPYKCQVTPECKILAGMSTMILLQPLLTKEEKSRSLCDLGWGLQD